MIALLAVQAVVFGLWAVLMFRALFALRRAMVAETGNPMPGPGTTLRGFGRFLTAPEWRRDRLRLGAVTLLMFALIALNALLNRG